MGDHVDVKLIEVWSILADIFIPGKKNFLTYLFQEKECNVKCVVIQ